MTPTLTPAPPLGQVRLASTGLPLIPSPTSGNSSASSRPIFTGQPGRNGEPLALPVLLTAYTRPLAGLSSASPVTLATAVPLAVLRYEPLKPPSSLARYSSLEPTTMSGLPSPLT